MARHTDSFNRGDTAVGAGLGSIPNGGPAWQIISGSWRVLGNRAYTDTSHLSSPIAIVAAGGGNGDVTITCSPGGGDAIVARVVDANNWFRARIRKYQVANTSTYFTTEYEWACVTQSGSPGTTTYTWRQNYSCTSFHGYCSELHFKTASSSNGTTAPFFSSTLSHQHYHDGSATNDLITHSHSKSGSPYVASSSSSGGYSYNTTNVWSTSNFSSPCGSVYSSSLTGRTRQAGPYNNTVYEDRYQVILEQSVNGTVSALGTANTNAPSSLRLRAVDESLTVYVNNGTAPVISAGSATNKTVNKFGIGRAGPTELAGTALDNFDLDTLNTAPSAPTQLGPAPGESLDATRPFRLSWGFNDSDIGDTQSRADVLISYNSGNWDETIVVNNPNGYLELPAGYLPVGTYQWMLNTRDQSGQVSPFSTQRVFYLANPPAGPSWVSPVQGGTVTASTVNVSWSVTNQKAYEIRRMMDDATTQIYTTGAVTSTSARSRAISFPTQQYERLQIRTQDATTDLWSGWTSIRVLVAFTKPPTPQTIVSADNDNARIIVSSIHPGGTINATTQTYERRILGESTWEQVYGAENLAPGSSYSDLYTAPGFTYEYRTTAHGSNGTKSDPSPAVTVRMVTTKYWLRDPDDNDGRVVTVSNFGELDRPREAIVFEPLGSYYPTVEYGQLRSTRGTFQIKAPDKETAVWVAGKLRAGRVMFLAMPPESDGGTGAHLWFASLRAPSRRLYQGKNEARLIDVEFIQVAAR